MKAFGAAWDGAAGNDSANVAASNEVAATNFASRWALHPPAPG